MNIYKQELKMKIKSVMTWSLSLSAMLFVYMSLFPAFASQAELVNEMMAEFPEELLMAFGMTGIDMASVLGFYGFLFLFCQVCLAIQASNYGISLVSVEERELTADFLLAKPVGRRSILTSKLLAALTGLTITNVVVWISSFVFLNLYSGGRTFETRPLILLLLSIVVFQLFFLFAGVLISLLMKRVRSVTPLSMALAFGMYVLSVFGGMLGEDTLEIITPFKHFDPNYIISNGAYNLPLVSISVAFIIIAAAGSYILYKKRDIHTAV